MSIHIVSNFFMPISAAALATRFRQADLFSALPEPVLLELAEKTEIVELQAGEMLFKKINLAGRSTCSSPEKPTYTTAIM